MGNRLWLSILSHHFILFYHVNIHIPALINSLDPLPHKTQTNKAMLLIPDQLLPFQMQIHSISQKLSKKPSTADLRLNSPGLSLLTFLNIGPHWPPFSLQVAHMMANDLWKNLWQISCNLHSCSPHHPRVVMPWKCVHLYVLQDLQHFLLCSVDVLRDITFSSH